MKFSLKTWLACASMVAVFVQTVPALDNGIGLTPPMGFNTWNWFGCHGWAPRDGGRRDTVTADMLIKIADKFVSSGMKDAGYEYICYDDCWTEPNRDGNGGLVARKSYFPNGVRALVDSIHARGLKFGMYTNVTDWTCQYNKGVKNPGLGVVFNDSRNHTQQDCDSFVAWGIDYLKVDYCQHGLKIGGQSNAKKFYTRVRDAIAQAIKNRKAAGQEDAHDMFYNMCAQGRNNPHIWGAGVGNSWRTTTDIGHRTFEETIHKIDVNEPFHDYASPGAWNDADMLEVGNVPLSPQRPNIYNEDRAHFSLWCMMASPLLAGNDLLNMNDTTLATLTNKEMIAVNQDSLGIQGRRVKKYGGSGNPLEVWVRPIIDTTTPDFVICFFNRGTKTSDISITMKEIDEHSRQKGHKKTAWLNLDLTGKYHARDLWAHKNIDDISVSYTAKSVPAHTCRVIQLSKSSLPRVTSVIRSAASMAAKKKMNVHLVPNGIFLGGAPYGALSVSLFDLKGALVATHQFDGKQKVVVPTAGVRSGIYFLTVKSSIGAQTQRVVVK